MKIRVLQDRHAKSRGKSSWLVVVPARLSATGKRQWRRFPTRGAASQFAAAVSMAERSPACPVVCPRDVAADLDQLTALLDGTGLTPLQACAAMAKMVDIAGSVANALLYTAKGAGEAAATRGSMPGITLATAIAERERGTSRHSAITRQNRAQILRTFLRANPELADASMAAIEPSIIRRALDHAFSRAPESWRTCHKHLKALYTWAINKGMIIIPNPLASIATPAVEEAEITPLHPQDLRALFAACRPPHPEELAPLGSSAYAARCARMDCSDMAPTIALMAFAGIRPTEATRLTWQDVDFEDDIISVRARQSKTGGTRHIPMHAALRAWLLTVPEARRTGAICPPGNTRYKLAAIRTRAGFGPHRPWQDDCLRHSFATYHLKAGGTLDALQLAMGHRDKHLIYTRYTNMRGTTKAMAAAWWAVTPEQPNPSGSEPLS